MAVDEPDEKVMRIFAELCKISKRSGPPVGLFLDVVLLRSSDKPRVLFRLHNDGVLRTIVLNVVIHFPRLSLGYGGA